MNFYDTCAIYFKKQSSGIYLTGNGGSVYPALVHDPVNNTTNLAKGAGRVLTGPQLYYDAYPAVLGCVNAGEPIKIDANYLDVSASANDILQMKNAANTTGLTLGSNSSAFYFRDNSNLANVLYWFKGAPENSIVIRPTGNVSIGENISAAKLAVSAPTAIASDALLALKNSFGTTSFYRSSSSPESSVVAIPGSIMYVNTGTLGFIYGKYPGTGNTGWGKLLNLVDPYTYS